MGFRAWGLGFKVQGLGSRAWGLETCVTSSLGPMVKEVEVEIEACLLRICIQSCPTARSLRKGTPQPSNPKHTGAHRGVGKLI